MREQAILFENAYTSIPLTLPAHASLFTGLPPPRHGVRDNLGYRLDGDAHPTLAGRLRAAGYATGGAVSAYVLRAATGVAAGFDFYDDRIEVTAETLGELERPGLRTAQAALAWLDDTAATHPVFLFLHIFEPHSPYTPPEPHASSFALAYDGEVAAADAVIGLFLDGLRRRGLYDQAVIVVLSDHGEGLGDHGESEHGVLLHRETTRVPLLLKLPGADRGGETVARPVQLLDIAPTVLDLLGLDGVEELPGSSLIAPDHGGTRRLYSETYHARLHFGWSELRSLVDDELRFIDGPNPELYDLRHDPAEARNVLQERRADARRLRAELAAIDPAFVPPAKADPREMENLRALGYLAAPLTVSGTLPDPKQNLPVLHAVREGMRRANAGDHRAAVTILEAVLEQSADMLDVRFQLAKSLTALGDLEGALEHYRRGLGTASIAVPALLVETGRILLALGDTERAASHAEGAIQDLPVEAHQLLAQIAIRERDLDRALAEADSAIAAENLPRVESLLLRGRILLARGAHATALETLDRARERVLAGDLPPVEGLEAERGEALGRLDRLPEAEAALSEEIRHFPGQAQAYQRLAFVYGALHRFAEIEPLLEQMVRANPEPATYLLAADTARRLGDEEGARSWQARAAARPPVK